MARISFYCGSKFARGGISEALGKEVARLRIRASSVAPGKLCTNWAGRLIERTRRSIADYHVVMDSVRAASQAKSGNISVPAVLPVEEEAPASTVKAETAS